MLTQRQFLLKEFHKIKLIQGNAIQDCSRIKLSCFDSSEIFIAANTQPFNQLPLNYFIFAYVIQQKMLNMGLNLYKCQ